MAGSRGLELQHSHAPSLSQLTNQDIAPHMASQHALLSAMMPKGSGLEQEDWQRGNRRLRGQKCKCKCSISQVSISVKPPSGWCKGATSDWTAYRWPFLTLPDGCLLTNNISKLFPCVISTTWYVRHPLSWRQEEKKCLKLSWECGGTFNYCALSGLSSICPWVSLGVTKGQHTHLLGMKNDRSQEPTCQCHKKQKWRWEGTEKRLRNKLKNKIR